MQQAYVGLQTDHLRRFRNSLLCVTLNNLALLALLALTMGPLPGAAPLIHPIPTLIILKQTLRRAVTPLTVFLPSRSVRSRNKGALAVEVRSGSPL